MDIRQKYELYRMLKITMSESELPWQVDPGLGKQIGSQCSDAKSGVVFSLFLILHKG